MATDIRPTGYIPQGTFSGYIPPERQIERRQRLADILGAQAMDVSPLQSPWQALARVAQGAVAGLGNYQAGQMEQERFRALRQAMSGGATADQLFATGDPTLMQVAQFKAAQEQRRIEAERQQAMLQLAINQGQRETAALGQNAPGVREGANIEAQRMQDLQKRAEAASRFITSARSIQQGLGSMVDSGQKDENGQPIMVFKPNANAEGMFGPIVTSPLGRTVQTFTHAQAETNRRAFDERVGRLAHDYATIQDPNHPDFQGARMGLPSSGSAPDAAAAYDSLENSIVEAQRAIDEAGGVAHPGGAGASSATSRPIPPPGTPPPQHPFQGAPGPAVNARAGQVPMPAQAGPRLMGNVDTGNGPPPLPQIHTPADFAALPSGTHFIDPEGNERVKP